MKLYHGTSGSAGRAILQEGLHPRSSLFNEEEKGGKGNWHHTIPSNPEAVYLTNAYAAYFGIVAASEADEDEIAIVEIETKDLEEHFLCPDEDFMEQASRKAVLDGEGFEGLLECGNDMLKRTLWFRDNILSFSHMWNDSIEALGTCCYYSGIDTEVILRVSFVKQKEAIDMVVMAMDPQISLLNYKICGEKYRAVTQWFMGETVTPEDVSGMFWHTTTEEQKEALTKVLGNQRMITVETP